ncbi:MAG: NAD-glutamate dehydrogenase [Alphaproteobacteria bacterium]|nr:NAD-glutamate dehydrogenase [Alphaproteobacteria bacterium]
MPKKKTSRPAAKTRPSKSSSPSFTPAPADFTRSFYAHVMKADMALFSANDREGMAASMWQLGQQRKPGSAKLRLFNPSPVADGWTIDHTVLEIVNDDMPFLVDSVSGALQKRGLVVHLVIHPVLQVRRDAKGNLLNLVSAGGKPGSAPVGSVQAESFMHIQFDHCLDADLLREIEGEIREVLNDVRAAVEDWPVMRKRIKEAIEQAAASKHQESAAENTEEAKAFMRWLDDNNFTYLGYRDIDLVQKNGKLESIRVLKDSGLGVLRDPSVKMFGGLRALNAEKTPTLQRYVRQHHLLVVTKTNQRSRVHRPVPMDAIFIRRFDTKGDIIGERLFVGLFTSQSYSETPREIPFLRRKIDYVLKKANFNPAGHAGKALAHILNNYPHDELFQISEEDLLGNSLGILQLQERAHVALFVRRDPFERFVTCLIYVPRERYDSALRLKFQDLLEKAFDGKADDWNVRLDDSLLARAFITLLLKPNSPRPDVEKLETELREICRNWADRLRDCLVKGHGEAATLGLLRRYGEAFPLAYRDVVRPAIAVHDIQNLERCAKSSGAMVVDLSPDAATGLLHLKLFQPERPIALSEVLPLIENMGLRIEYTGGPYEVKPRDSEKPVFIHEFVGRPAYAPITDLRHVKPVFEEAFGKVWTGDVENDAFNSLVLRAGMPWREVVMMRALARYLRQLRIPYSHEMIAGTFLAHPQVAQQIYALFFARHNPDLKGDRTARCRTLEAGIQEALAKVEVLEEDRIIRRYLNLVQASLRTNYFQTAKDGQPKPYLSIKFDSRAIEFMPLPKPLYEIFVHSPQMEAVHLRGGKVARGGIRWSDRRDDFRNEILGLMKAQMVKNSVIVPVGSKGGFIVKRPSPEADKHQAEGIACYRVMMQGLLDVTDNRQGNRIIPPARVVRHDDDDPYLVVAADKGTARFSDIANSISQEYGFWLDDAFASGGSAGYDHKQMAITARGAWEAVKRHFREIGKDIQTKDFTCIGVGDMSGDVFGNGMLLSKHTRLLGAFDHRHIFCDPDPDTAESYAERLRMFALPRSSWGDYDAKKISKGGGIFARSEKIIRLTPQMKKAYGISADSLAPADLIQAMLKAEVELLYFGGIGTFVKASDETHEEVGDRVTEPLRIDATDLRAQVVGEGANLGFTQRARIEYALKGGRINTDAIDNSAGVDTSDHEVNIKILLRKLVDKGQLTIEARNKLLRSMTDDVAKLVLQDNYYQTQTLSVSEERAPELLPLHVRCMHILEKAGLLNRDLEFLPHSAEIAERQRAGKGLTRPEMAVLLAYAKIWLYQQLLGSDLPDDAYLQNDLMRYFPEALQKKYPKEIQQHPLQREIIATSVTNSVTNSTGSAFVMMMADRTGQDPATVMRAYLLAREAFGLRTLWEDIDALDNQVPAKTQTHMLLVIRQVLVSSVLWFLTEISLPSSNLAPVMETYRKGVESLASWLEKCPAEINGRYRKTESELAAKGAPEALARRMAMMPALATALDLTRLSQQSSGSMGLVAGVFFGLGQRLGFDWLSEQARNVAVQTPWQRDAVVALVDELAAAQRRLTHAVVGKARDKKSADAAEKIAQWLKRHANAIERYDALLNEWRGAGAVDIAMLSLASHQLNALRA